MILHTYLFYLIILNLYLKKNLSQEIVDNKFYFYPFTTIISNFNFFLFLSEYERFRYKILSNGDVLNLIGANKIIWLHCKCPIHKIVKKKLQNSSQSTSFLSQLVSNVLIKKNIVYIIKLLFGFKYFLVFWNINNLELVYKFQLFFFSYFVTFMKIFQYLMFF